MSLDVTLYAEKEQVDCTCGTCGHVHKNNIEKTVFEANVTHNLNKMAHAAGIYEALWRPGEIGITKAKQLIVPLTAGLAGMRLNPEKFRGYEPENKWGDYSGFVAWVERYLNACKEHPEALVRADP